MRELARKRGKWTWKKNGIWSDFPFFPFFFWHERGKLMKFPLPFLEVVQKGCQLMVVDFKPTLVVCLYYKKAIVSPNACHLTIMSLGLPLLKLYFFVTFYFFFLSFDFP